MNELTNIEENQENINIENLIYEIRGVPVILDSDIAKLYKVETKRINEAVRRNKEKFPKRYSFTLNEKESSFLVAKCDQKKETRGGRYKNPRVFTEYGVVMLSTILKSDVAIKNSIKIIDAFVKMRKYISSNLIQQRFINNMVIEHDNEIKLIQETLDKFEEKEKINEIYFEGQIYDSYSKIKDIMFESKEELIIIDSYADKTILDMIKNINSKIILITSKKSKLTNLDISKYNEQYKNLKVIYDSSYHDRYFIIDRNKIYHCGTSINYAGNKTFSINILEDKIVKNSLISEVLNLIKEMK